MLELLYFWTTGNNKFIILTEVHLIQYILILTVIYNNIAFLYIANDVTSICIRLFD